MSFETSHWDALGRNRVKPLFIGYRGRGLFNQGVQTGRIPDGNLSYHSRYNSQLQIRTGEYFHARSYRPCGAGHRSFPGNWTRMRTCVGGRRSVGSAGRAQ